MKKIIAIIIAITIAFIPVMGAEAASRPAKVKSVKVTKKTQTSVTLKWKKAKRAKKYQVFVKSSKKYKKVKTLKKTKVTIKKLKAGKTYRFKVRGIRGKKVGKFSKVIKVSMINSETYTAVKKVGQVKKIEVINKAEKGAVKVNVYSGKSVKATRTVTLKWSKSKNAKKYQVWQWVETEFQKTKTLKGRKIKFKLNEKEAYKFKVCGINGKKKGKYSEVITVRITNGKIVDFKTVHKVSSPQQIKKPGTYQFTNPLTGRTDTVKVEDVDSGGQFFSIQGTKNGFPYHFGTYKGEVVNYVCGKGITTDYRCSTVMNSNGAHAYETQAKTKNTIIKWTCDGTDPAKVTGDKWGHCEYTKECVESVPYGNPKPRDQKKWDEKYKHEDGYWKYLDTYLYGITTYGKYRIIMDNNKDVDYRHIFWVKVYKNGKMIFEQYLLRYEIGF